MFLLGAGQVSLDHDDSNVVHKPSFQHRSVLEVVVVVVDSSYLKTFSPDCERVR